MIQGISINNTFELGALIIDNRITGNRATAYVSDAYIADFVSKTVFEDLQMQNKTLTDIFFFQTSTMNTLMIDNSEYIFAQIWHFEKEEHMSIISKGCICRYSVIHVYKPVKVVILDVKTS